MSSDESRRFTDREVAIVLKKAAEIDEEEGTGAAGGLSIDDLKDIAKSVGISPDAIVKAARGLDQRVAPRVLLAGAPLVRRSMRAVQGELGREAIAQLVRRIDEESDSAGAISEALGSVRWTSADRFRSRQITITPADGETRIQVVEKIAPRVRRILHLVPSVWGLAVAGSIVQSNHLAGAAAAAIVAGVVVAGAGIGRLVYNALSIRSGRRVERLAADLADDAAQEGLLEAGPRHET
jgi:hypothetical protein